YEALASRGEQAGPYRLYWPQVQHQLYVAGAAQGWLVFYAAGQAMLEFPVARDETFLTQELVPACLRFWALIAERKAPLLDPVRDLYVPVGEDLDHWAVLAGAYRDLLRDKARLEGHLKETTGEMTRLEHALVGMMGGFLTAEAAGLKVTRYQQNGAIDYAKALKAVLPELDPSQLESYRRKPSERVRITALEAETATVPFDGQAVDACWQQAASESFFF
ncbi:MAG: endonuclease, partial [Chromatiaceae bacterium]